MIRIYYVTGLDISNWGKGISNKISCHINLLRKEFCNNIEYISVEKLQGRVCKYLRKINPFSTPYDVKKLDSSIQSDSVMYLRYFPIDFCVFRSIKKLRKRQVKILLEIPTFPYDNEIHGFVDWMISLQDKFFRKYLYKYIHKVITYSRDDTIWGMDTIKISNAVNAEDHYVLPESVNTEQIDMIAVASFAFWHGYDRLIKGLGDYYRNGGQQNIYIHFVGNGKKVLDEYRRLAEKEGVSDRIVVHGIKYGKELNVIYAGCNLGIDSLGRHRAGIVYNSSLKGKEYLLKGLPIVSGVETELDYEDVKFYYRVAANDKPIDICKIIDFFEDIYSEDPSDMIKKIRTYAKNNFSYEKTFSLVIEEIKKLCGEET